MDSPALCRGFGTICDTCACVCWRVSLESLITVSSMHRMDTTQAVQEDGVRFGRTLLRVQFRNWTSGGYDAMVLPNNRRGLMGVNFTGGRRIDGGLDVEREAMTHAPMTMGTAIVTGSGTLQQYGIDNVVHAIVGEHLGDAPREVPLRQATVAAMRTLDQIKVRHAAIVPLGSGSMIERVDRGRSVPIMIEEMIGHLRRSSSRVESITFLCNSESEMAEVGGLLERMRRDWWGLRV